MQSFYRQLNGEEEAIRRAMDQHEEALKDEKTVLFGSFALWTVAFILLIISEDGSRTNNVGEGLIICAVICYVVHIGLHFRTRKRKRHAKSLVQPYLRRQALPFYQELVEMFADKPGVHLHLNDNGSITVTDKREEKK